MSPVALIVQRAAGEPPDLEALAQQEGFWTRRVGDAETARTLLRNDAIDVCLLREPLPGAEELVASAAGCEVVVVGRAGADSQLRRRSVATVACDAPSVASLLRSLSRIRALEGERDELRRVLRDAGRFDRLVGTSAPMQRVFDAILLAARDARPVLVRGAAGGGKEAVARAVHRASVRRHGPFVCFDCERLGGDATGTSLVRASERARGGTLLLRRLEALTPGAWPELQRLVAAGRPESRLMATLTRLPDPSTAEAGGGRALPLFRDAHWLVLPPLASRPDDVECLADHFLAQLNHELGARKRWTLRAIARLRQADWKGGVSELESAVRQAFLSGATELDVHHLPLPRLLETETGERLAVDVGCPIAAMEKRLILATLEQCRGNKPQAARLLGISLKTLYGRLSAYRGAHAG